jgi:aldose 1-epimerase
VLASVQYRLVADDATILTLRAGEASVTVHPADGGRIGQISVGDRALLVDVPPEAARHPMAWGSFPMAPWAGRIRNGRFSFGGEDHQLVVNHHDGDGTERAHAIHGLVFDRPCLAVETPSDGSRSVRLRHDLDWPFGGTVTQTIDLAEAGVSLTLVVESTDGRFPAEVGWHPWFRKPDRLDFSPIAMYRRDRFGIPTGELVEPAEGPWDDCFANTEPIVLRYDRPDVPVVVVTSDCDHVVVFDEPADATCVEPQSGPPDAFNLSPDLAPGCAGPHVVEPGAPLRRSMRISWPPDDARIGA